jgi:transcriptional regulator GlxA family with amidase domain
MAKRLEIGTAPWCSMDCIAAKDGPVTARAGLRVITAASFGSSSPSPVDVLIVPGGIVDAALDCPQTLAWISAQSALARITASVCTGAFLLAASGVLRHERVTPHWEDVTDLQNAWPTRQVVGNVRWVDSRRTVTSAGLSAGIGMSLHLVE